MKMRTPQLLIFAAIMAVLASCRSSKNASSPETPTQPTTTLQPAKGTPSASTLTTDSKCGSRLKISYLTSNFCPVCKEDLRPEYILKSIRAADAKLESATKKLCDYIEKHSKKEVRWLVKIEYHT